MNLFRGTAGTGTGTAGTAGTGTSTNSELVEAIKPKTPAQLAREADVAREIAIKDAEAKARLDEIERAARFKREQEERERDQWRASVEAEKKAEKIKNGRFRKARDKAVPYAPLFLVNTAAITGQIGWATENLAIGEPGTPLRWVVALIFGVTIESIALFLQYYANRALLNRDSAASLYVSAFMVAGIVAALNFSHWSAPAEGEFFGTPNATAIAFALCSFASPWLWRIHNRAEFREILRANGEIDARAVKLSAARKIMYPIRSFQVIRLAAWQGETNPARAVELYEARRIARAQAKAAKDRAKAGKAASQPAKAVETTSTSSTPDPASNGRVRPVPPASPKANGRDMSAHAKWKDGLATYSASLDAGSPLNTRELAAALGQKNKVLASAIIRHVKAERGLI